MNLVAVGKIIKAYGLKGMVKVSFEAFFMEFITELDVLFLEQQGRKIPYFVESIEPPKANQPIQIKFEGVNSKEAAISISRSAVFVDKGLFPGIEDAFVEEHEWDFVIGFVAKEGHQTIGKVTEIFYTIQQATAQVTSDIGQVYLVPLHKDLIVSIEEAEQQINFDLPDGLLDL